MVTEVAHRLKHNFGSYEVPGNSATSHEYICIIKSSPEANKNRHGTDPWSHQILPLLKLELPRKNGGRHDHGFALQVEDHGKNLLATWLCIDSSLPGLPVP